MQPKIKNPTLIHALWSFIISMLLLSSCEGIYGTCKEVNVNVTDTLVIIRTPSDSGPKDRYACKKVWSYTLGDSVLDCPDPRPPQPPSPLEEQTPEKPLMGETKVAMRILVGDNDSKLICSLEELKALAMMAEGMKPQLACEINKLSYSSFRSKFLSASTQVKELEERKRIAEERKKGGVGVYRSRT